MMSQLLEAAADTSSTVDLVALKQRLAGRLSEALADLGGFGDLSLLKAPKPIPDAATQILVRDPNGRPCAVLLCSAQNDAEHDLVRRGMDCARRIKDLLGPDLGGVIVDPLLDLYMDGRTFALFPYCPPLSDRRLVWPIQRRFVRSHVLTWLRRVTQATQRPVSESQRREAFIDPLNAIADDDRFSRQMRQGVEKAAERLQAGEFQPRFVIAHNDLWKGNILLPPSARDAQSRRHRFVVVDWPAARTDGYAFYDLLRLADSLRISRRRLTGELRAHCRVLECSIRDATAYLLAGLAVLGENLGYFDPHRYVAMSEQCFIRLQDAVRE